MARPLIQIFCIMVVLSGLSPAFAAEQKLLTGAAAFGDWTKDEPGVRRLIKPQDLPPPGKTKSSSNGPSMASPPNGAMPKVPEGFEVSKYLSGLKEPRQMRLAPNGDVFLAESGASRIQVLHPSSGNAAPIASVFVDGMDDRPYGIAFYPPGTDPQYVYVATETEVLRYPYKAGDQKARGPAEVIVASLPEGGHWTRDIQFTPDGKTLLVAVGSASNHAEGGMESEKNRADIIAFDPDGRNMRIYASGLRNPVTIGFHPETGDLWTSVNERDGFGDNLPPDYVTRVKQGGFYGWPYYYIGAHEDPDFAGQRPELKSKVLTPDVLLQPHSAPLGFAIYEGKQFPAAYKGDLFVALHGSWNRAQRTGYKLVRVRLDHGKPTGEYDDFMTGFVTPKGDVWGRPVGVVTANDGSLLVSDDASGTIWRIAYKGKK